MYGDESSVGKFSVHRDRERPEDRGDRILPSIHILHHPRHLEESPLSDSFTFFDEGDSCETFDAQGKDSFAKCTEIDQVLEARCREKEKGSFFFLSSPNRDEREKENEKRLYSQDELRSHQGNAKRRQGK